MSIASHMSRARISKSKRRFNVKSSTYYFHMKTEIWQICISVPLKAGVHFTNFSADKNILKFAQSNPLRTQTFLLLAIEMFFHFGVEKTIRKTPRRKTLFDSIIS